MTTKRKAPPSNGSQQQREVPQPQQLLSEQTPATSFYEKVYARQASRIGNLTLQVDMLTQALEDAQAREASLADRLSKFVADNKEENNGEA